MKEISKRDVNKVVITKRNLTENWIFLKQIGNFTFTSNTTLKIVKIAK